MSVGPSRRDVLATFLGAAFAASSCRRGGQGGIAPVDGELLGPSHARGHRLRDRLERARWVEAAKAAPLAGHHRVLVIGGGPAGLSAAWRLGRAGLSMGRDVRLLELEEQTGGTAASGESSVSRYPWGAHYVPVPHAGAHALIALLDEMGVATGRTVDGAPIIAEEVLCRAPEERLFSAWNVAVRSLAGRRRDGAGRGRVAALSRRDRRLDALRRRRGPPRLRHTDASM
jgi:NADPH-dependent 2,4-dienoyl-CoA reductase/sulfur reductase-like enzyme